MAPRPSELIGNPVKSRIVPFAPEHVPAVQAFNRRLATAGAPWRFPETSVPDWLPRREGIPVWQEYFLLVEQGVVRGAHALKRQGAALWGEGRRVVSFYWPLSEGAIDPAYKLVGTRLLRAAVASEPLLFVLGPGGGAVPAAALARLFGWRIVPVAFYFKVLRPVRFLRRLRYLRDRAAVARLLDLAAVTGVGWLALKLAQLACSSMARPDPAVRAHLVERFGAWSDAVWAASAPSYSFVGLRDAATLNATYPPHRNSFARLRVARGDTTIGWAVVEDVQLPTSKHFGDMHVGTIVDGLAPPEHAGAVIRASADVLARRGMDLLISNQSHPTWRRALVTAGFLRGPSSWRFAAAPALARLITAADPRGRSLHVNRGDGDGPWGMELAAGTGVTASG